VFGDLVDNEWFISAYLDALKTLHKDGARATVAQLVSTIGIGTKRE
jgi:hypothetical protein